MAVYSEMAAYSDDASIVTNLRAHILGELHEQETAIALLANDTLANLPPLTFFGDGNGRTAWLLTTLILHLRRLAQEAA
jgi:signal-transduction protein with cAMP-binding, CBS, and nucleotidyltransferase domain